MVWTVVTLLAAVCVQESWCTTYSNCNLKKISATFNKQYLTTPRYPDPFPRPSYCTWVITAVEGDRIVFKFWDFDLESSIFCYKDLFTLLDGATGYELDLFSMCGDYKDKTVYKSSGRSITVDFRGVNPGPQNRGFNISFWTEVKLELPEREPEFTFVNYAMWGAGGLLGLSFAVGMAVLVHKHWHQVRECCIPEDDDDDLSDLTPSVAGGPVDDLLIEGQGEGQDNLGAEDGVDGGGTLGGTPGSSKDGGPLSDDAVVKILISPPTNEPMTGIEKMHGD